MARHRTKIQRQWNFANIRLSAEQRDDFTVWCDENIADIIVLMTVVLMDGYKLSVRWDDDNETWIVTLTGTELTGTNDQTSMSGRHRTLEEAMALMYFKHVLICNGGTWETKSSAEDWG